MKEGDRILCKKSIGICKKNNWYVINNVYNENITLKFRDNRYYSYMFSLKENISHNDYFYGYFYSKKELRKLKLQKLKNEF